MPDLLTIIATVVTLAKSLATVIDGISTLIIERRNYENRIVAAYEDCIFPLSKDLLSIKLCAGVFGYNTEGENSVLPSPGPHDIVEHEYWSGIKESQDELGGYLERV